MTRYRGLLTDREREILRGKADVSQNYVYQIRSRVRQKIDRLRTDTEILEANHPDLAEQLRNVVADHDYTAAEENGVETEG
jgi:ElaB/YqjD/DUF883 family membrane-anchored ribosome-binding protein